MTYKIIQDYLTPNKYSRPQLPIRTIKGIVIHWVANPNTSAKGNRDFFESRKGGLKSFGSAHEIIDLDGDVHICLPKTELAYHVGSDLPYQSGSKQVYTPLAWERLNTNLPRNVKPFPNNCTYGIEATHIDWDGKMTNETYNTLVERCADLCIEFKLNPLVDIYTHQEVVGWKDCHRWFVNNPNEWKLFKEKVKKEMETKLSPPKQSVKPTTPTPTKTLPTITKERIYAENGVLKRCDGNYKIVATDVRHLKLNKGTYDLKFVWAKGKKVSELCAEYGADYAINFSLFWEGNPVSDTKIGDKIIANVTTGKTTVWNGLKYKNGIPSIGKVDINEDLGVDGFVLKSTPMLIEDGKCVYDKYIKIDQTAPDIANSKCQRTMVGLDAEGNFHISISDGRTDFDRGLSLLESALYMQSKKCVTAISGDGGGSVVLCDKTGALNQKLNTGKNERAVNHALLIFIKPDKEPKNEITDKEFEDMDKIKVELKNGDKTVLVDGFLSNGKSYVDLRTLSEFLGAKVGWDQANKRASVKK